MATLHPNSWYVHTGLPLATSEVCYFNSGWNVSPTRNKPNLVEFHQKDSLRQGLKTRSFYVPVVLQDKSVKMDHDSQRQSWETTAITNLWSSNLEHESPRWSSKRGEHKHKQTFVWNVILAIRLYLEDDGFTCVQRNIKRQTWREAATRSE